jgi:hypothetical protein
MSNEALIQQLERTIETPTAPSPANGTAGTEASGGPCSAVARWLAEVCVGTWRFTTNARLLWREICAWSGRECTEDEFATGLERRGFVVERGMVEGLALNGDFLAAIEYERERLRSKKAVQLDLFNAANGEESDQEPFAARQAVDSKRLSQHAQGAQLHKQACLSNFAKVEGGQ